MGIEVSISDPFRFICCSFCLKINSCLLICFWIKYGNIAQVWSAFEIRTDPKTESNITGLNSIQLHYENERWFIDSWTCEMESEKNNLVTDFLNEE